MRQENNTIDAALTVVYIGTATYDDEEPYNLQTSRFREAGWLVIPLKVTDTVPVDIAAIINKADVILVSGGNTLYACDRWKRIGLSNLLKSAVESGVVMCGGSAGAICWFDGGHSDSHDPETYHKKNKHFLTNTTTSSTTIDDGKITNDKLKNWEYIRVQCLGFYSGLVCPHYDKIQSNGILRKDDFASMLLRHSGERGIGIDHYAALVVRGGNYKVLQLPGKTEPVPSLTSTSGATDGVPRIWVLDVEAGVVKSTVAPLEGKLCDLLRPAAVIVQDERVETCRLENPDITSKFTS